MLADRQRKQVGVRHLPRRLDRVRVDERGRCQGQIICLEYVAGQGAHANHKRRHGRGRPGRVGIVRVSHDAHHGILGRWTGCPRGVGQAREPSMRRLMKNMRRIDQADQHIDVEQPVRPGSSRSALTISGVTIAFGFRTGSNGMLLRSSG